MIHPDEVFPYYRGIGLAIGLRIGLGIIMAAAWLVLEPYLPSSWYLTFVKQLRARCMVDIPIRCMKLPFTKNFLLCPAGKGGVKRHKIQWPPGDPVAAVLRCFPIRWSGINADIAINY